MGAVFLCSNTCLAQQPNLGVEYAEDLDLAKGDPRIAIVELVRLAITFVGIIAVVYLLYAGFLWMTSAGNEEKVAKAKKTLINAIIGLVVILSAFLIVSFVINKMNAALSGTGGPGPGSEPNSGSWGLGASGNAVIETHYPVRGQTDVPRNTSIAITFRELMKIYGVGGLMNDDDTVSTSSIMIAKRDDFEEPYESDFTATTTDGLTFVFRQSDSSSYLGNSSEPVWYRVVLSNNIIKENGNKAWPIGDGYFWDFQISTIIDITPPRVKSVIPRAGATEPRNVVIQINFNEAIDPASATGEYSNGFGFRNIEVSTGIPILIDGAFYISNEYRTVEFLTTDDCGGATNSCGEPIFCLPALSTILVLAKAAELGTLANGILDMAANSLDGNKNGIAEGPGATPYDENTDTGEGDNYTWSFDTTDTIDISAPVITEYSPDSNETDVNYKELPAATFSKFLMSKSVNKNSISFYSNPADTYDSPYANVFYWFNKENGLSTTTVFVRHDTFTEDTIYAPEFNSGIKDIYQNCYFPSAGSDQSGPICAPDAGAGFPYCCDGALSAVSCEP